jgi:phage/plasmid primase-like uncharacterized protein
MDGLGTTPAANRGSKSNDIKQAHFTSRGDIENAFFNHAADVGVEFTKRPLIADGILHRAHVVGDKRGTKNGAYVLYVNNNPAGWFMHYSTGIKGKWALSGKREPMTRAMRAEIEQDRQRRIVEQQRSQWNHLYSLITNTTKYCISRKRAFGLRLKTPICIKCMTW